jgi:transcriptional regulator with XRE-family HTH domain
LYHAYNGDVIDLRKLRMELSLTQKKAAEILGVEPNTFARWERGVVNPSGPSQRLILALSLRISPEALIRLSLDAQRAAHPPAKGKKSRPRRSAGGLAGLSYSLNKFFREQGAVAREVEKVVAGVTVEDKKPPRLTDSSRRDGKA